MGRSYFQLRYCNTEEGRCTERSVKSGYIVKSSLYRNWYKLDLINHFLPNMEGKWVFFTESQTYVKDTCFCVVYTIFWENQFLEKKPLKVPVNRSLENS